MSDEPGRETGGGETDICVLARRVESSANAIATMTGGQVPVTARQRTAAFVLALDLLATAGRHGVTRPDLDGCDVGRFGSGRHAGPRPLAGVPTCAPSRSAWADSRTRGRPAAVRSPGVVRIYRG
jgi:hypothetical protein